MRINHNISAMNTYRQYNVNTKNSSRSMEKLSSGFRINRAADDAAGLSISEKMRSQIRGLTQATRNAEDGVSFIQTAEGALNEVSDMLTRLKELSVQVQNGTYSNDDKANIGAEMNALGTAISEIYVNTKFNGIEVFGTQTISAGGAGKTPAAVKAEITGLGSNGDYLRNSGGKWQVSSNTFDDGEPGYGLTFADAGTNPALNGLSADTIYKIDSGEIKEVDTSDGSVGAAITFNAVPPSGGGALVSNAGTATAAKIAYGEGGGQSVEIKAAMTSALSTLTNLTAAVASGADAAGKAGAAAAVSVEAVENAITEVNTTRATYGALQNQLEHAANNLSTTKENLQSAESRVRDVDMAEEMMEFTKNNILTQAAQSMLAQANSQPQGVLQLLQ